VIAILALLATNVAFAQPVSFRVVGVQGNVLLEQRAEVAGSLGQASHRVLQDATVGGLLQQYRGSEAGVNSINGLGSALEVLSDTQMNAYGWCYQVDGEVSDLLADQYVLTGQESRIEWFYAYARLDRGQWTSMCVPADHEPAQE
jgi:hypothetical protein